MNTKLRWLYAIALTPTLALATTMATRSVKTIAREVGDYSYLVGRMDAHKIDEEFLSRALNVEKCQDFLAENLQGDEFIKVKDFIEATQPEVLQPLEWQIAQRTLSDTMWDEQEKNKPKFNLNDRLADILGNLKFFLSSIYSKKTGA